MLKKLIIGLSVLVILALVFKQRIAEQLFIVGVSQQLNASLQSPSYDGIRVTLCGAGSPLPDPERSAPCTHVIAGDQHFLFDAGSINIGPYGLSPGAIEAVFLTHFHSDHIAALGDLMMQRWVANNHKQPLPVYGPDGVQHIVAGFNMAYAADSSYRTAHHGEAIAPTTGKGGIAKIFDTGELGSVTVYEKAGVVIQAFRVSHNPVEPAVGYRIDYQGRSVVISGDTTANDNLMMAAKDTDVIIHEALSNYLVSLLEDTAADTGQTTMQKIFFDIRDYHTDPVDAAKLANKSGAKALVFSHIVPMLPVPGMQSIFLKDTDKYFDGQIAVGKDGTTISLAAGNQLIQID